VQNDAQTLCHATCVAYGRQAILIIGPSGSGKSDLALRLLDGPPLRRDGLEFHPALVSDDQVLLQLGGDELLASAPASIRGKLEVRGLGIVDHFPLCASAGVRAVVTLVPNAQVERMPDFSAVRWQMSGVSLPLLHIDPWQASATVKIRTALRTLC